VLLVPPVCACSFNCSATSCMYAPVIRQLLLAGTIWVFRLSDSVRVENLESWRERGVRDRRSGLASHANICANYCADSVANIWTTKRADICVNKSAGICAYICADYRADIVANIGTTKRAGICASKPGDFGTNFCDLVMLATVGVEGDASRSSIRVTALSGPIILRRGPVVVSVLLWF
jgi:hypothetical protein